MRALVKKKTQWKEDVYFAEEFARQKLSKYYAEVTPTTGMLLISAHIHDPFRKLRSFRKWDTGTDINPEDETSYTTRYQDAFLKYVENEHFSKHRQLSVTKREKLQSNDFIHSAMPSQSGQSLFDPYDLSSGDEEDLKPKNLAKTTPGRSNRAACLFTATRLYLNSLPQSPKNWGQVNPNLDDYHSNLMRVCSTFWIPDIAEWWQQQGETHSKYADLSNVACDIFSFKLHGVGVEASLSLGRDIIRCRQSKTTGKTLREKIVVRQYARANNGILAGNDPVLDRSETDNNLELKREAFKLSERSPLPPALSAKKLAGGRTQVLNVRRIWRIDRHPAEGHDDSAPETVADTENWLNWNSDLDNPNES